MAIIAFNSSVNPLLDNNGNPMPGGKVFFYTPGTLNFKSVFAEAAAVTALESPMILDGNGRRVAFLSGDYDVVVKDKDDNQMGTINNFNPDTAGAATGVNVVTNGSFELNTLADGKTPDDFVLTENVGGTASLSTDSIIGAKAMKFVAAAGTGGGDVISENFFEVAGGDVLTATFWLKASVVDLRILVQLHWYDSAQALISSASLYDDATANPTAYTRQLVAVTAPATARFGKIQLFGAHPSDPTNGDAFFDGVEVISSSLGSAFVSGTSMVFAQVAAPAGWTKDTKSVDRVLMFGAAAGSTEAGTWTISGLSGTQPTHQHGPGTLSMGISDTNGLVDAATPTNNHATSAHKHPINAGLVAAAGNDTVTVTHAPGWRPNHRIVIQATRD